MKISIILASAIFAAMSFSLVQAQEYSNTFDNSYFENYSFEEVGPDYTAEDYAADEVMTINPAILEQLREIEKDAPGKKKSEEQELTKEELLAKLAAEEEANRRAAGPGFGAKVQGMFSEYWVQFLALVVSLIGVVLAVSGFSLATKKKQKYLKKYLHEIDDVYSSYKWKTKRCEAELYRLQDQIEDQLKEGKIDENTYHLLEKRIEKYLDEIKYAEERPAHHETSHKHTEHHSSHDKHANAKKLADQIDEIGKDL